MKKILFSLSFLTMFTFSSSLYAGGAIENTNQSAEYQKNLNRYASTDVDAVHFNPAGTAMMEDGLHLYVSYQFIYLPVEIKSDNTNLNEQTYIGDKTVLIFPNFYAVYKMNNVAFSLGFVPIGGGGDGTFDKGLPFLEHYIANLTSGTYIQDTEFKGSSAYISPSVNIAYKINNIFSLSLGYRFIYGMGELSGTITGTAGNMELDTEQTGTAHGIILGAHIKPINGLDIGMKFAWNSQLTLKNDTKVNSTPYTEYNDGEESKNQLPMTGSIGIRYNVMTNLNVDIGFIYYFNKEADWGKDSNGVDKTDNYDNGYEISAGFDYTFSGMPLNIGMGYLYSKDGAKPEARSDLEEGLDAHAFGIGATWSGFKDIKITLAHSTTYYPPVDVNPDAAVEDEYHQWSFAFAIGITYKTF